MFVNEMHQGGIRAIIDYDNTVFDNLTLPDDINDDDTKALLIDTILYKYGDAPLFSPDPSVVKYYIGRWSSRRAPLWDRYYKAVTADYDPLSNYDRTEKRELTHGKKITYSGTVTDGTSGTITDGTSGTITDTPSGSVKVERDDTTTENVSAYNSSTWEPSKQSILDGETNTSYNGYKEERSYTNYQEQRNFTNYQEQRTYNNSDTNSGKDSEETHTYGNIGVTTSQQMLISELDLNDRLDIINYIADDWHSEFNLMIYV